MDSTYNEQDNEEIIDEYSDISYSHTNLIGRFMPKRLRNNYNNNNNFNNNNNNNNTYIDNNSDNNNIDINNKSNVKSYNRKLFRGSKNNYNNISSIDTFSVSESEEENKNKKERINSDLEENIEVEFEERGNSLDLEEEHKNSSEFGITPENKVMNTFNNYDNNDIEQQQTNNKMDTTTPTNNIALNTPNDNDNSNNNIHTSDSSNINSNSITSNENSNNNSSNPSNYSSYYSINNNNPNNTTMNDNNPNIVTQNKNLLPPVQPEDSSIISNPFKDKSVTNSSSNVNNTYSNPFNDSTDKNTPMQNNNKPFSNPFKDSSDSSDDGSREIDDKNNLDNTNDIIDVPTENNTPFPNKENSQIHKKISTDQFEYSENEKSLKFNLTPDIVKRARIIDTVEEEDNVQDSNLFSNNYGSVETSSSGGKTSSSSIYNSDKRFTSKYNIYSESSSSITIAFDTSQEDTLTIYLFNNIYYIIVLYFMILVSISTISYSHGTTEWMSIYVNITSTEWTEYVNANTSISNNYIEI